jgi:hypothetical protein
MTGQTWLDRVRSLDVRLLAAIVASILLFGGVMWVVPTTPDSQSFTFDSARRTIADARPIAFGATVQGNIVDGSDTDYYRVAPRGNPFRLEIRMVNGSRGMVPALRVFDGANNLVADKTSEYLRQPGANIDCSVEAQADTPYFVEVFTQRNTAGAYTLTVTTAQP